LEERKFIMKDTKVVVMSAEDIAALRTQKKEVEKSYREAKVAAFKYLVNELKQTGEEYTAMELSGLSGLSVGEITANLSGNVCGNTDCTYAISGKIASRTTWTEEHYAQILPDGTVNTDKQVVIKRRKNVYFHR
jgi:hypothetical protein